PATPDIPTRRSSDLAKTAKQNQPSNKRLTKIFKQFNLKPNKPLLRTINKSVLTSKSFTNKTNKLFLVKPNQLIQVLKSKFPLKTLPTTNLFPLKILLTKPVKTP